MKARRDILMTERSSRVEAEATARAALDTLAAEREAVAQLDEVTRRLFASNELQPLLDDLLDATISLQHADFGHVQLYDPQTGALEIAAQRGFGPAFLRHFRECRDETTSGGRAFARRARVVVADIRNDPLFGVHLEAAQGAGYLAVQSTPLVASGGTPLGVISTCFREPHRPLERELRFTDLYARLAAELIQRHRTSAALRASEERFRRYFDLGLIGMAITSVQRGMLEVYDELCRILGYAREELLRLSWSQLSHPEDVGADAVQFDRVLAGEIDGYTRDKRWIRKDGQVIHSVMSARCVRRPDSSVEYFVGLILDTTERERAKAEIAASERRFRLFAESIPHHVWSAREDGVVTYWNRRLADYTGLSAQELRAGGWHALHPDEIERARGRWELARERGLDYEFEHRLRGRDGRYRRFMCRAVPVAGGAGRPTEWVGTNTDVEDRCQAEDALHALQAQLAHVTRATTVEETAAAIAHEIRQPLTAVIANGQACARWLAREIPDIAEAQQAIARLVRDALRACEVVASIRASLRHEAPMVGHVAILEVVRETLATVQGDLRGLKVAVSVEADEDLPAAVADRVQIRRVLLNLVRNALDAMAGVEGRSHSLVVEIRRHDDRSLRISLCDSGVGLGAEQRERAFRVFHTDEPDGRGMGLAVSRSIVEAHGGRLWASANATHGETFSFTVPIAGTRPP